MGDYNPRQITQMRWKDVKNLEKFKFITGNYDFTNEVLEHASEDKQYRPFIDAMIESNNKNQTTKPLGIIVNDSPDAQVLYVGTVSAYSISMRSILSNYIYNVDMSYNYDTDILTIEWSEEEIMSTDNVKTLFGNQSIIGTGNIDLYRHYLTITDINGKVAKFEWISSSNINVSGVGTKLKDLLKCSGIESSRNYGHGYEDSDLTTPCIMYWLGSSMGILSLKFGSSSPSEISNVVDIVETI